MAFNPFLSMNEPIAPADAEELNPFMMSEAEPTEFSSDNPFATSNPFSDLGGYEPPAGDTVPVDIFGTTEPTGIGAKHFDGFSETTPAPLDIFTSVPSDTERMIKPTDLDLVSTTANDGFVSEDEIQGAMPSARPLPPETQNLILTVTGQMEFTSSHLLDRIPPTRTPSPVSVRDIHSTCPTPEPEIADEPLAVEPVAAEPSTTDSFDINRNKPMRPPPARPPPATRPPPPRPTPPRPPPAAAPAIVTAAAPAPQADDINLFDAPIPTAFKPTKEDIMSLYSAPKVEEKQIDFLSDDLQDDMTSDTVHESQQSFGDAVPVASVVHTTTAEANVSIADADAFSMTDTTVDTVAPMDCSEPHTEIVSATSNTSPFADVITDGFQAPDEPEVEGNPFETATPSSANIFDSKADDVVMAPVTDLFSNDNTFGTLSMNIVEEVLTNVFSSSTVDAFTSDASQPFGEATQPFGDMSQPFSEASQPFSEAAQPFSEVSQPFGEASQPFTEASHPFSEVSQPFGETSQPFSEASEPFSEVSQPYGEASQTFSGASQPFSEVTQPFAVTDDKAFSTGDDAFNGIGTSPATDVGWGAAPDAMTHDAFPESQDAFDAFSAKFDSTSANNLNSGAWGGGEVGGVEVATGGFEAEAFDPFLSMGAPPPPAATPRLDRQGSRDSTDDSFSVFIRPKDDAGGSGAAVPALAPPPRPQALPESPRANPFDKSGFEQQHTDTQYAAERVEGVERRDSGGETPPTPLFDDDVSMPLEDFPRTTYSGPGWEMHLRQPNKKKITGHRFWKKIFVRLAFQGDNPVVQLYTAPGDKEPFQELPLQACYSVSEIAAQQFDQFGKIFTVKLQYVFYKERPGVRPGQVTKAERITNKLSQFAAYAIQGDYQGVKEFGSDLRKLGLPVEHAPQVSQLFKLGSLAYEDVKQFSCCVEEALFRLAAHRDRALTYKMEEVQITAVDELYVEQDAEGAVLKQIARVRLFFLGFLSGMPDVELGVNDLRRQGKEVVGRHDIIPVVTEEWIRVENAEFHACVQPEEFGKTQIIKFKPPDACYIELMRFRVRPPKNRELPLQLKAVWCVTGNKVELRADVLVPGFASRKLGQVPCEDVAIRFPIPESWIYLFRVEKHFRYGSVKSAHRRTGKIKGIERFLGAVDTLQESLIEVTSGQAKYEHQHRAIVWRMPRLPKEGQGAYTTHNLVCRMALTSYDQIPAELARNAFVEFTMPATQVSHMTVRSVSLQDPDRDDPPEKYVRYLARHEYTVGIERTSGSAAPAYSLATTQREAPPAPAAPAAPPAPAAPQPPSSDSDSD